MLLFFAPFEFPMLYSFLPLQDKDTIMEKTSLFYIKEWQKALKAEIAHLKKYGSKKYAVLNGRKITGTDEYTYYFDSHQSIPIPNGSIAKLHYGDFVEEGRILSSFLLCPKPASFLLSALSLKEFFLLRLPVLFISYRFA